MRPAAIIERLRTDCAFFATRVAGLIGRDDALDKLVEAKAGLAVPCAYVVWEGDAPADDQELTTMSDQIETTFSITVIVSGTTDLSGQDASERLLNARDALFASLIGWTPDAAQYGRGIYDGAPDAPIYNRAYGATTFVFSWSYYTDNP